MKFLLILFFSLAGLAHADGNDRYLVQDGDYQFEVVLDKKEKAAQVLVLAAKEKLPSMLDLVLYRSKKKPLVLSIKAIDIKAEKPTYSGALDIHQESVIGLALQWNFNLTKKKIKGEKTP